MSSLRSLLWGWESSPEAELVGGSLAPEAGESLRVMTWNLHFGAGAGPYPGRRLRAAEVEERLSAVVALIKAEDPDIVALQEVDRDADRSGRVDQLLRLRELTGLRHAAFAATWDLPWVPYPPVLPLRRQYGRVRSGLALLSRFPLAGHRRHALPKPGAIGSVRAAFTLWRVIQEVQVDLGRGRRLTVLNAHLEAFDTPNRRLHARLLAEQMRAAALPAVLLGDLNAIPPEASARYGFVDEPDEDHRGDDSLEVLRGTGWTELSDGAFTFPAGAATRRLDHIFASPSLLAAGGAVLPCAPPPSDHEPLGATLRWRPELRLVSRSG